MKKLLMAMVLLSAITNIASANDGEKSDAWSKMQWYVGAGLAGQSTAVDMGYNGLKIFTAETSNGGINLNGGVKWKYLRLGADITSTSGTGELSSVLLDMYADGDVSSVKYALEGVGVIPVSEMVSLEAGVSVGAIANKLKGAGGVCIEGFSCANFYGVYGLLLGVIINFTENHAMTIQMKGFGYGGTDTGIDYSGAVGEFALGYRYSF
ncbi:MAG: hypothetical protein LBB23_02915 [Rickettsiales bacterium]|jgi:hypothetical protein|nr:hypothetical protein [Rickettsiales bacterium]